MFGNSHCAVPDSFSILHCSSGNSQVTKDINMGRAEALPLWLTGPYGVGIVTLNVDVCFASTAPVLLVTVIVTS